MQKGQNAFILEKSEIHQSNDRCAGIIIGAVALGAVRGGVKSVLRNSCIVSHHPEMIQVDLRDG